MATDTSLSTKILETTGMGYAVALFATLLALLLRLGLNPFLGEHVPYITLLPAIAFRAWYCGIGPSIVSVAVALLGAQYLFISPIHSVRVVGMVQVIGILVIFFHTHFLL